MNARALLACAGLLLAACPEPGDPVCSTQQLGGTSYVRQGQQVTVRAGIQVSCFIPNQAVVDRPLRVVKEVEVEVLDPDNKPVLATSTAPDRSGGNTSFDVTTDVTFTLDKPGPYTVIARFEPSVGQSQQLVRTLAFRADAGFRELPTTLPPECTTYGLTASGTPLCVFGLASNFGDWSLAIGDQRFPVASAAIDGDAIWVMGPPSAFPPKVERLVAADGGKWVVSHRYLPSGTQQGESQLAAGGGQAYLYGTSTFGKGLERLVPDPDDGGFTVTNVSLGSGRLPIAVSAGTDVTLVLAAGSASAGPSAPVILSFFADGGSQVAPTGSSFLQRLSEEEGTLWLGRTDFSTGIVSQATVLGFDAPGGVVRSGSVAIMAPPMGFQPPRLSPLAPVVRVRAENLESWLVLPVLGGSELALESFVVGPGYEEIASATRRHAFARSKDGTKLKVIDR